MRCHVKGEIFTTEVVSLESEKDLLFEDFSKRRNSDIIQNLVLNFKSKESCVFYISQFKLH